MGSVELVELGQTSRDICSHDKVLVGTHEYTMKCEVDLSKSRYAAMTLKQASVNIIMRPSFDSNGVYLGTEVTCFIDALSGDNPQCVKIRFFSHVVLNDVAEYDLMTVINRMPTMPFEYHGDKDITGIALLTSHIVSARYHLGLTFDFLEEGLQAKILMLSKDECFNYYFILDYSDGECCIKLIAFDGKEWNEVCSTSFPITEMNLLNRSVIIAACEDLLSDYIKQKTWGSAITW